MFRSHFTDVTTQYFDIKIDGRKNLLVDVVI